MSFSEDIRDAKDRFPQYVKAFEKIFRDHQIHDTASAWSAFSSSSFRADMSRVAGQVMSAEGSKITFGVMFAIIGAALGGVGVAAMGGAIGVPLAVVGAFVGLVLGNEADTEGYTSTFVRKLKAFYNG